MSKTINRATKVIGELRTVGSTVVRVINYDRDNNVIECTGATQPSDSETGYAKGCIFRFSPTGGSVGSTVYINEGTSYSADFNSLGIGSGGGGGDELSLSPSVDA